MKIFSVAQREVLSAKPAPREARRGFEPKHEWVDRVAPWPAPPTTPEFGFSTAKTAMPRNPPHRFTPVRQAPSNTRQSRNQPRERESRPPRFSGEPPRYIACETADSRAAPAGFSRYPRNLAGHRFASVPGSEVGQSHKERRQHAPIWGGNQNDCTVRVE